MSLKTWMLSSFRELFLYHHHSLEFRAKVFALIIAPCINEDTKYDYTILEEVTKEIYKDDTKRQDVLIHTTKEYVKWIANNPKYGYDDFIKNMNLEVKIKKELAKKINLEHIRRFLRDDIDEKQQLLQLRIFEFLENLSFEDRGPSN